MEQNVTHTNDVTNIPDNLPGDKDQAGSVEQGLGLTPEQIEKLLEEQPQEADPSGSAAPGAGEDAVLFVETFNVPEQAMERSPEDVFLGSASEDMILEGSDLEEGVPWHRSRWMFVGTSLIAGTALSIGAVLLVRGLNRRNRRLGVSRNIIKPLRQARRRRALFQVAPRMPGRFGVWTNQLSEQANRLTGQAQRRFSLPMYRTPGGATIRYPLQRRRSAPALMNRTRRQLALLSARASGQLGSLGTTTRMRTAQAMKGTQENLAQLGRGMTLGVEKTGESLKHSWRLGRTFALGAAAGAIWAALFTPQSGQTTRQHLTQAFQARLRKE